MFMVNKDYHCFGTLGRNTNRIESIVVFFTRS